MTSEVYQCYMDMETCFFLWKAITQSHRDKQFPRCAAGLQSLNIFLLILQEGLIQQSIYVHVSASESFKRAQLLPCRFRILVKGEMKRHQTSILYWRRQKWVIHSREEKAAPLSSYTEETALAFPCLHGSKLYITKNCHDFLSENGVIKPFLINYGQIFESLYTVALIFVVLGF